MMTDIEIEFYTIRDELMEMFPAINNIQYILRYDLIDKVWNYGHEDNGKWIEISIDTVKKLAAHYRVETDIEKIRAKFNRLIELHKLYKEA